MSEENAGQRALSSRAVGEATKDYGPSNGTRGEGFGRSLVHMTISEMNGEIAAQTALDPLAGKIIGREADGFNTNDFFRRQNEMKGNVNSFSFSPGTKVYHKVRKKEYTVKTIVSNDNVVLVNKEGKQRKAKISDLVKL